MFPRRRGICVLVVHQNTSGRYGDLRDNITHQAGLTPRMAHQVRALRLRAA